MDKKIFKCQDCNTIVAEETGKLVLYSELYEQIRSVQGHENGDRTDCRNCGRDFGYEIIAADSWREE